MNEDPGQQPAATDSSSGSGPGKKPWTAPEVTELPRLTDLTLQTGIPGGGIGGGGDTGNGGSTVF